MLLQAILISIQSMVHCFKMSFVTLLAVNISIRKISIVYRFKVIVIGIVIGTLIQSEFYKFVLKHYLVSVNNVVKFLNYCLVKLRNCPCFRSLLVM